MSDARLVLTGEQCREARRLLRLSQAALAQPAGVYPPTVGYFEDGTKQTSFPVRSKLRTALVAAGV